MVAGAIGIQRIDIGQEWSIEGTDTELKFKHKGNVKREVSTNTRKNYEIGDSEDYWVLTQKSKYEDYGIGIKLSINVRIVWNTENERMTIALPKGSAVEKTIGNVIITWEEDGETYSTSMGKCYIKENLTEVEIDSTVFKKDRTMTIQANIQYEY